GIENVRQRQRLTDGHPAANTVVVLPRNVRGPAGVLPARVVVVQGHPPLEPIVVIHVPDTENINVVHAGRQGDPGALDVHLRVVVDPVPSETRPDTALLDLHVQRAV